MPIVIGESDLASLATQLGITLTEGPAALIQQQQIAEIASFQVQQGPSAAGAQVEGAFVDLSAVPKFHVADTGLADTDFTITHNLGGAPAIYLLLSTTVAGSLYGGPGGTSSITLRFSGANADIWVGLVV